jgi:hypothetical protein
MAKDVVSLFERYAAGHYQPVTFLERGVALPFTTPQLLGARLRPGGRQKAELVVANPAGVEGVYVLPWSALTDICTPSLHDRALWGRVSAMPMLTPRAVRDAARAVAAEGYAGREAARAVEAALAAADHGCIFTHYHLLLELVRQAEPPMPGVPPPERDTPRNIEQRARAALERMRADSAISGGMAPAAAVEILEEVAKAFEGCGLRGNPTKARLPALIQEIASVTQELAAWGDLAGGPARGCVALLVQSAQLTLRCGQIALATAHAELENIWALLHRWRLNPEPTQGLLARPEWLLDGWELICGLWRRTPAEHRGTALLEMASMVPVVPAEAQAWVGFDAAGEMDQHQDALRRLRRVVKPNQDWISGRLLDLTQRNESVRAAMV